jgi:hypothetical protein
MFLILLKFNSFFQKRHSHRHIMLGMLFYLWVSNLAAQKSTLNLPGTDLQSHWKLGLSGGTAGIGIEVGWKPAETPWIFRAKYSYMAGGFDFGVPIGAKNIDSTFKQTTFHIHTDVRMSHWDLLADYLLSRRETWRLTFGLAYHPNKSIATEATIRDFRYNKVVYTPKELGMVTACLSGRSKISPYVGIGFGQSIPKKRIRISGELGVYYLGNWLIDPFKIHEGIILDNWTATKTLELKDGFNSETFHKLLPNLSLVVHYRLY